MLRFRYAPALAAVLSSSLCFAQGDDPPRPTAPTAPDAAPTPEANTTAEGVEASVELPAIQDAMLEPLPRPRYMLGSWPEALRRVRSRSTSLASSVAQVRNAAAQARSVISRTYPTVSATGSVSQHLLFGRGTNITAEGAQINVDIPDPSTLWNARLSVRQPVLDLKSWYDIDTAELAARGAVERAEDIERQVLANVAETVVMVVTAERLAEVSRVTLRSALSTLDLTRRRARLGASSAVDVLRAQQEVALNRAQVVSANESLRRAREALGMALGYSEPWGVTRGINIDGLGGDAKRLCSPVRGIEQRSDIQAAQTDVLVARRNADSADYRLAPTVDVTTDLNYTTQPFTANGRPMQWTIGALLTIPLFDGGARAAERQVALAQADLAEQNLIQARRDAELQVRQSMRSVAVAGENLAVGQQSRDLARETLRLAKLSFLNGKGTSFELVDAMRRYQQAELDLAVQEFEVVRARIIALLAAANCDLDSAAVP